MQGIALLGWSLVALFSLWLGQTVLLALVGHRPVLAFPLRHRSSSAVVRWGMKLAIQLALVLFLLFPLVLGDDPLAYYRARLVPARWDALARTMGMTLLVLAVLLLITVLGGWVKVTLIYSPGRTLTKVLRGSLTPLPLAFMEETVFRGVFLEQLLRSLPQTFAGQWAAIVLSALLFSSVHFLREQKRVFLPALGLFGLGLALGVVYVAGGHTLWLPVAIHGAGVWYIQAMRPFTEYRGPVWLIGSRSYPICGALGLVLMAVLTTWVVVSEKKTTPGTTAATDLPPAGGRIAEHR